MARMYLMCGLPAVGKTTFAKQFAKEHNLIYVGIDDYYRKVNGDECIRDNPAAVWLEFAITINELEKQQIDCIIDVGARTKMDRDWFMEMFPNFSHHLICVECDEQLRYKNNNSRHRQIPDWAMKDMAEKWERPVIENESSWRSILYVWNDNNLLQVPQIAAYCISVSENN